MSEPFIAEVKIFAGNFAPRGWATCDGQLLPIAQNTALFSLIGTIYGGDGRTTTALPNIQGRAVMHPGRGPGLTSRRLGERAGTTTETLLQTQMPAHGHPLVGHTDALDANPSATRGLGGASWYATPGTVVDMAPNIVDSSGTGDPHTNIQPYLTLLFIIALVGQFPSRN